MDWDLCDSWLTLKKKVTLPPEFSTGSVRWHSRAAKLSLLLYGQGRNKYGMLFNWCISSRTPIHSQVVNNFLLNFEAVFLCSGDIVLSLDCREAQERPHCPDDFLSLLRCGVGAYSHASPAEESDLPWPELSTAFPEALLRLRKTTLRLETNWILWTFFFFNFGSKWDCKVSNRGNYLGAAVAGSSSLGLSSSSG